MSIYNNKIVPTHPLQGKLKTLTPALQKRVVKQIKMAKKASSLADPSISSEVVRRLNEKDKRKKVYSPQERMKFMAVDMDSKVRISVPKVVKLRKAALVQSVLPIIGEADNKGYDKFKTVTIGGNVFSARYLALCYGCLFLLDSINGRISEIEKGTRYVSQLFHGLRVTEVDDFSYSWAAPETLFTVTSGLEPPLFPTGIIDVRQFNFVLSAVNPAIQSTGGSNPLIGAPAALTDADVRLFGKPVFIDIMNFVASASKPLVEIDYAKGDYEKSCAAFARYTPLRGYNESTNGDYPGQIRAMYNRAIIEVKLVDWEVWLACMGFGEDDESREGHQYDYMGNAMSIGYHRNYCNYANRVPGETWIKIKTLNIRDMWRAYLASFLKANEYKYPGTNVLGLYTFNPASILTKMAYNDLYNTFVLSLLHKYTWGLVSGNVTTDLSVSMLVNCAPNMIGVANWNMLQPCWLTELARDCFPVVRGKTVTYVCLSMQGSFGMPDDEILTCLNQIDSTITSIAASPFIIDAYTAIVFNSTVESWATSTRTRESFRRLKQVCTALQQNLYFESFTGEKNGMDCTLVHYSDFVNEAGAYVGTTNVQHMNIDALGYDMARPLPTLVVSDPLGLRPFDITALMSLYDERFMILAFVETLAFQYEVWILRVMDFPTPTNTSMQTENALDTYEATRQHIGGGFFSAVMERVPGIAKFAGKVQKVLKRATPDIRKKFGDFAKSSIKDLMKAAQEKGEDEDDVMKNPRSRSESAPRAEGIRKRYLNSEKEEVKEIRSVEPKVDRDKEKLRLAYSYLRSVGEIA